DGGGHGAIATAACVRAGLEVPSLSDPMADGLRAQLPAAAGVTNPVDLAGGAEQDVHAFDRIAHELLASDEVDALLVTGYFGGYAEYGPEVAVEEVHTARQLGEAARATGRPIVVHTMYPEGEAASALRESSVPVYDSVEQATQAVTRLAARGAWRPRPIPALPQAAPPVTGDGYETSRRLLADAGIRFVAQRTVRGAEEAVKAASEIGYPVVLKALAHSHKSDAGGVMLGIADDAELRAAVAGIHDRLGHTPCSVEQMAPLATGVELLIGARRDPRFGPVALAGCGGVYAEILRDTQVALAPVGHDEAESMLLSLRAAPLLTGTRGRPPLNVEAAAEALAALSATAAAHPELAEIEINPLLVTPTEALALDARLVHAHT
ncbi:MAG: acetate--CoA ligase family protein, partial [Solirubrobacteraceae bacterium]